MASFRGSAKYVQAIVLNLVKFECGFWMSYAKPVRQYFRFFTISRKLYKISESFNNIFEDSFPNASLRQNVRDFKKILNRAATSWNLQAATHSLHEQGKANKGFREEWIFGELTINSTCSFCITEESSFSAPLSPYSPPFRHCKTVLITHTHTHTHTVDTVK